MILISFLMVRHEMYTQLVYFTPVPFYPDDTDIVNDNITDIQHAFNQVHIIVCFKYKTTGNLKCVKLKLFQQLNNNYSKTYFVKISKCVMYYTMCFLDLYV